MCYYKPMQEKNLTELHKYVRGLRIINKYRETDSLTDNPGYAGVYALNPWHPFPRTGGAEVAIPKVQTTTYAMSKELVTSK